MMALMLERGMAVPLKKRPNSFLFRTDPSDVARVEDPHLHQHALAEEAGPTNNWVHPDELIEDHAGTVPGLYERPDDVRHPLLHGSHWFSHREDRR